MNSSGPSCETIPKGCGLDSTTRFDLARHVALMRSAGTDLQTCEVKSAEKEFPKDCIPTLSAFSNGSGGILLLGLSEREGFAPVSAFDPSRMQDALADACSNKLIPPVRPEITFEEFEGKPVLVAKIPEMPPRDKPCYVASKGLYEGSFIRTGDGDRKMSHYEINRLLEERAQPRHDVHIVQEAVIDDLDQSLVDSFLKRERALHPRVFDKYDDHSLLVNLRVVAEDDGGTMRPTLAGLLALGEYPQKYFPRLNVSFAAYPGTTKASFAGQRFLDSADFVGPIPFMIADAVAAVTRNMRTASFVEGAFREDVPDYPREAVREAVANALMHRDYSSESWGTQVQVNMFADRLEILSPGGLYGTVTVDTLGTLGVSSTRNEFLSKILGSTPYPHALGNAQYVVENKGTGFIEIRSQLSAAKMEPPQVFDRPGSFSLVFKKRPAASIERHDSPKRDAEQAIVNMALENGPITAKEVEAALRLSRVTVLKHINHLMEEGVLESSEPATSKKRRYRLTKQGMHR